MKIKTRFIIGYSVSALLLGALGFFITFTFMVLMALLVGAIVGSIAFWMYKSVISKDEIGVLALNFNLMADKLSQSYHDLEEQTLKHTQHAAELEKKNQSLENTEKAMLNILEDARGLEEELKVEKEGVEKKVEEKTAQLTEEKTKLQASISSLSVGFIMTDIKNNIVTINQSARDILCASDSSPLTTVKECTLSHVEDELKGAIDLRSLINKCVTGKKPILIKELTLQNRYNKFFLTPIMENSLVLGTVILVEDITEAKLLERSRDEFFSIASHELRTPLTAIKGNTSMILDYFAEQLKDPQMKEMIDDIHESSVRLIEIVNDFLDTSRLELGKMEFKKDVLDLSELIPNVIKEYQVTSSRKKLYIHFENIEKTSSVMGDKDRFKQVLINLIGNALKFTQEGGITISLKNMGKFIKVLIADTGMGISEDNQKLLFRKFQQAESNILTRDVVKGTGLGLYISKMMVEGMKGTIQLESSVVDKGTTFSFTLPVAV